MSDSLHIVCPHCEAVNRVPSERLGAAPTCGRCHRPLFTGHPLEAGEVAFEKHLTRNDIPVLMASEHARVVRSERRQFRVFEGGLGRGDVEKP